jgi:hypothetical protein
MAPIIRVLMLALAGALVTFGPAHAEQSNMDRLWDCLGEPATYRMACPKKRCDEAAAKKDAEAVIKWVVREEQYNVVLEAFRKHGCTEADMKRAIARDQQVLPKNAPPPGGATRTCPQITQALALRIEQANPNADGATKYIALEKALQLYGCLPTPPPPQTTECMPNSLGGFTCTTR